HAGQQFKIAGKTHLHCEHPKYPEADKESGKISPYDTLMEFWNTCNDFESKKNFNNIEEKIFYLKDQTPENMLEWITGLNKSGYAGCNRQGTICDRREF